MEMNEAIAHAREKAEELKKDADYFDAPYGMDTSARTQRLECAKEHEQLASWLTELAERREADRWIPVRERLPDAQEEGDDFSEWVLVTLYIGKNNYAVGRAYYCFSEQRWYSDRLGIGEITAWKPLPKPYESEETNN